MTVRHVLAMMTTNDFDDEEPTLKIPRETMLESRERSAPAHAAWGAHIERADTVPEDISDGVPTLIENDATTEPHVQRGAA